ncbi:hypothetical protein Tco_0576357 [Tanacetum coccineum]
MANISKDIQCAGSDTRPPMLDRTDFASWQQCIRLYCQGNKGALHLGPEQARVYSDFSPEDKDRYNADIRATNILLQGLSKDIYTLINHYTDAKDIWDIVKMLLEGSELTKEDREPQLYDDFENFRQNKGETIHHYYVWFSKLINDMRNINMTMSKMQLNSKFVNNMLPEWGRFVTAVKLNRGLRDSNYDQLYAYLKQHKAHANENKMMVDRIEVRGTMHGVQVQLVMAELRTELGMQIQLNQGRLSVTIVTADDCDAFDSDVDEAPTAQTMFMANLSSAYPVYDEASPSYDSDILSEEQVELYERRAKFELTKKEQKIEEELRIVITDRNIKEENLKKELHSVKMQLSSTINHNKSMVEEVASLKKDFKQKENKYLEEFLDMKALKEKVEDKLYKQDQSIQIVNMLCKPKPYYDEQKKVHNSEDTLEIAKITRKKMNEKMKDPECMKKKVKIAPHDYSKENYLATFTPKRQLTLEQIFWSKDLIKMKAEDLKEQTTASRPVKALTVYPPNTPATLVPKVLPTKRERGFEQTKECYLTEVIPFFKTLKEHFEGIQKALTKEVKEMKGNFEELEAELTVSRFIEMHDAHTVVQARCLELKAELSKLYDKVKKDDHTELVKCFSNLKVNHQNWQLKYQNLKESLGNNTSLPARDAPDFDLTHSETGHTLDFRALDFQITQLTEKITVLQEQNKLFRAENAKIKQHYKELYDSIKIKRAKHIEQTTALLTENENLNAQIHENLKCITVDSVKPRVIAPVKEAKVERPLDRSLASACLYTKHSQELLAHVIGTCLKDFNKQDKKHASSPLTRKKQVTFKDQCETSNNNAYKHVKKLNIQKTNVPVITSTGVNSCTDASGSQPRSNTKKNRILPAKSVNKKKVEEHPRTNKSSLKITNRVDSSISSKRYTMSKDWDIICFLSDNFAILIWKLHSCYVRDTDGVEIIKGSRGSNLYTILVEDMMKSSPICLLSKASKNKSWL